MKKYTIIIIEAKNHISLYYYIFVYVYLNHECYFCHYE